MTRPANRRGFLSGLLSLPLIGGGVTLIGAPSAVALPTSLPLLEAYKHWLAREYGETMIEVAGLKARTERADRAMRWCRDWCEDNRTLGVPGTFESPLMSPPSTRAALVLSAVGHNWREGGR